MRSSESWRLRDEVLNRTLRQVAESEVLSGEMVFQGGGALHFIYSSPRYSEDLDFVAENLDERKDDIVSEFGPIEFEGRQIDPEVKEKMGGELIRISYQTGENQPSGKVEIFDQRALDAEMAEGAHPVTVESPEEIYADKVVATFGRMDKRGSLKPTDLFDLDYLNTNFEAQASADMIERKAETYDIENLLTESNKEDIVDYIENSSNHDEFRSQINDTLVPDVAKNRDFDEEYFQKCANYFQELSI